MKVEVTEFVRPNGERRIHSVDVADDCAVGYEALRRKGCRLTAEYLMTGAVSQTVEHEEGDFLIEVTFKHEENIPALEKMLREFDGARFDEWLKEMNS
jgi:hypothetical protein